MEFIDKNINEELNKELEKPIYEMATTSNIYKRLTDDKTAAIISPYRSEYSEVENQQRMLKLKQKVRAMGYGFNQFISRWVEDGISYDEQSLLIPNIKEEEAKSLGREFDQSSIIFKDDKNCREICITPFENYNPNDVVRVYYNSGKHVLNIAEAQEIFSKRKGGPASMSVKGSNKKPFTLRTADEVIEVNQPRPSYFQTKPTYTKFIWKK